MKPKYSLCVFLALAFLLWIYLWLRALFIPLVHDEIATFHNYIQIAKFLPYTAHWDANNHILNSALSSLFYRIFGLSPLVIRLANLLLFPLFCLYVWRSRIFFTQPLVQWAFMTSLLMAHGLIEFFSLSRGYGISMALMMPALYYLIRMTEHFSLRRLLSVILWSAFATLANLSLVNTYLLIIIYLILFTGFSGQFSSLKQRITSLGWIIITGIPFLILFTMISFEFRAKGLLYTGGSNGIWKDTILSLVSKLFSSGNSLLLILVVLLFSLILAVAIIRLAKEKQLFSPKLIYLILLSGNLAGAILLHMVFRVNYPENRVALFLYPLFIGALCFAMDDLSRLLRSKAALISLIPLTLIPIHFFTHLNLSHASFYIEDLIPPGFYQAVKTSHQPGEYPPIVSGKRLTHFCWSFYDFCADGTESQISFTNYPEKFSDFQIADSGDLAFFGEDYLIVDSTSVNHRYLLKRIAPAQRRLIIQARGIHTPGMIEHEFFQLYSGKLPDVAGQSAYVGITAEIFSPVEPFHTWMVAEVSDSTGKSVQYERVSLYWFRPAWNESTKQFKNGFFLSRIPPGASNLKVYVWNIEKVPFRIENGSAELFLLTLPSPTSSHMAE
ncbi:MAG: hypothetical protein JXA23_10875 [Bacteroidales bacterium]|nr:hypothetical protein [Bacteroidales bacterium]